MVCTIPIGYASQQLPAAAMLAVTSSATMNAKFELNGQTQTVAAINNVGALSIIQNLEADGTGTGLLIVSNNTVN